MIASQLLWTLAYTKNIPEHILFQLDNAAPNKSYTLFGVFGIVLKLLPMIKSVRRALLFVPNQGSTFSFGFVFLQRDIRIMMLMPALAYLREGCVIVKSALQKVAKPKSAPHLVLF